PGGQYAVSPNQRHPGWQRWFLLLQLWANATAWRRPSDPAPRLFHNAAAGRFRVLSIRRCRRASFGDRSAGHGGGRDRPCRRYGGAGRPDRGGVKAEERYLVVDARRLVKDSSSFECKSLMASSSCAVERNAASNWEEGIETPRAKRLRNQAANCAESACFAVA